MVGHALPFAKLATLMMKTVAKPISKRIKKGFPTRVLVGIGQTQHSVTSRLAIWSEGYTVRRINPLSKEQALENGADFVGESFVLLVSMGTVILEYNRSAEKTAAKEAKLRAVAKAEREALQANFKALDERLKAVEEVVQYNSQSILNVRGKRYVEPKTRKELVRILKEEDEDEKVEQLLHDPMEQPIQNQSNPQDDQAEGEQEQSSNAPWWKFW